MITWRTREVAVKRRKAMTVRLEDSLEMRNLKLCHQTIVPRTFNQHFMKTDTVHARFARSKTVRQTNLARRGSTENLLATERSSQPSLALAKRKRSSAVRASFPGQNGQLARNGAA
jgi:hypothetical protein